MNLSSAILLGRKLSFDANIRIVAFLAKRASRALNLGGPDTLQVEVGSERLVPSCLHYRTPIVHKRFSENLFAANWPGVQWAVLHARLQVSLWEHLYVPGRTIVHCRWTGKFGRPYSQRADEDRVTTPHDHRAV